MNAASLLSIALCAAACGPALAQDAPERPRAEARLVSSPHDAQRWHGVGDVVSRVQLCVESNTGRFQLRLFPQSASVDSSSATAFDVLFSASTGERGQKTWDGRGELTFDGRSASGGCGVSGNVTLEFRLKQRNLTAAVAGDYVTQMRYTVDPA